MKKIAIASLLAATFAASATELEVKGIRDTTQTSVSGYAISIAHPVTKDLTVKAGFENTKGVIGTNVDTYKVDASYDFATVGPVTFIGLAGVGHTKVQLGSMKGAYGKFGVEASVAVPAVKGLTTSLAVTRQLGETSIKPLNHTETVLGLRYKLTETVSVNGTATFYENVSGSKMGLGVAYSF